MSQDTTHEKDGNAAEGEDRAATTRRRLLVGGAATWATVGLAGCGGNAQSDTTTTTTSGGSTDTGTAQNQAANYVVTAETGTGEVPEGATFASSCSATRRFVPGMMVVFYVGIFDPETGNQLTNDDLQSVSVNVDGGPTVDLEWAGDDEENPAQEWAGTWTIPEGTEPGTFSYTVQVQDGDANFATVGILEDSLEVIEFSNPTNYIVSTETHWEGHPAPDYGNGFIGACTPERQFSTEMDVSFRIGVYNGNSGEFVGSDTLSSVRVESADGAFDPIQLEYLTGEEENTAEQWYGVLETENLSPGTYGYEVVASDSGGNFVNVGIASNQFTIIEL